MHEHADAADAVLNIAVLVQRHVRGVWRVGVIDIRVTLARLVIQIVDARPLVVGPLCAEVAVLVLEEEAEGGIPEVCPVERIIGLVRTLQLTVFIDSALRVVETFVIEEQSAVDHDSRLLVVVVKLGGGVDVLCHEFTVGVLCHI